jgi:hypothetical protein
MSNLLGTDYLFTYLNVRDRFRDGPGVLQPTLRLYKDPRLLFFSYLPLFIGSRKIVINYFLIYNN